MRMFRESDMRLVCRLSAGVVCGVIVAACGGSKPSESDNRAVMDSVELPAGYVVDEDAEAMPGSAVETNRVDRTWVVPDGSDTCADMKSSLEKLAAASEGKVGSVEQAADLGSCRTTLTVNGTSVLVVFDETRSQVKGVAYTYDKPMFG